MEDLINPKTLILGLVAFLTPVACVLAMNWQEISDGFECDPSIGSMVHLYAPG